MNKRDVHFVHCVDWQLVPTQRSFPGKGRRVLADSDRCVLFLGISGIDQVLNVLLTTAMFVGGCVAFILDNTIPGMWYMSNMLITYVNYFFAK